jgi:hypothetical protein
VQNIQYTITFIVLYTNIESSLWLRMFWNTLLINSYYLLIIGREFVKYPFPEPGVSYVTNMYLIGILLYSFL